MALIPKETVKKYIYQKSKRKHERGGHHDDISCDPVVTFDPDCKREVNVKDKGERSDIEDDRSDIEVDRSDIEDEQELSDSDDDHENKAQEGTTA